MHITKFLATFGNIALLSLPGVVEAGQRSTYESCYTVLGTKSISQVPTHTTTVRRTVTHTFVRNTHAHSTVTPNPVSTTITSTNTVTLTTKLSQETDTFTSTEAEATTITKTVTTDTSTQTDTSSTTVYTSSTRGIIDQPTPDGWKPILDTLPSDDSRLSSNSNTISEQVVPAAGEHDCSGKGCAREMYPNRVECFKEIERHTTTHIVKTRTRGTVIVSAPASTSTVTITTETSTTITQTPDHVATTITKTTTSTDTATETQTPSTTVTVTQTSTETEILPGPTDYSNVCGSGSDNFSYSWNGHGWAQTALNDNNQAGFQTISTDDHSEQECCISCWKDPLCGMFGFIPGEGIECYLVDNIDAPQKELYNTGYYYSDDTLSYILGNGPYGQVNAVKPAP